ncbi:MAG: hypothetical protein IJD01_01920 [Clostridia bacterium]|nr:hypothetical protein [Clostridia bacterium]
MRSSSADKNALKRLMYGRVAQVGLFFLTMLLIAVIGLLIPLRPTYSELEERQLKSFPSFSAESLVSGTFFDEINEWYEDTFPMRGMWVQLNSSIKQLYGATSTNVYGEVQDRVDIPEPVKPTTPPTTSTTPNDSTDQGSTTSPVTDTTSAGIKPPSNNGAPAESLGAILKIGDSAFEYYNFSQSQADRYAAIVNRTADRLNGTAKVYVTVIPTSIEICLDEKTRAGLSSDDQAAAIRYHYGMMTDRVTTIDAYDALSNAFANGEYIFFRTDHHWTALGAYRTYERYCAAAGLTPTPLSAFEYKEFPDYLGSFYRSTTAPEMKANPDIVQAYVPPSTNTMDLTDQNGETFEYPIIADVSEWAETGKYYTFIGSDNPLCVIDNPNVEDGRCCVLVKESFGNAYAPFLTENYDKVYVVDYRYFSNVDGRSLEQLVRDVGADDVLFLNNISATRNEGLIDCLDYLAR